MVHKSSLHCAILTTSENEAPRNFYQVIICDANSRDVAFAKMQPAACAYAQFRQVTTWVHTLRRTGVSTDILFMII